MRCQDIATDLKYEIKGRIFYGNFMVIEDVASEDTPDLLLLTKTAGLDLKSKMHAERLANEQEKASDLVWLVSVDLTVVIIRWPVQRPEVVNIHSQYTTVKLPFEVHGQTVGHLLREVHVLAEKEPDLFARIFSRLPKMNGVIEPRIKLIEQPLGDFFMVAKHLEMALYKPFEAKDDHLSMLFIAGRPRFPEDKLRYAHAMDHLKQRQLENFGDDEGVFGTYQVSAQELSARKSRASSLLKKFVTRFQGDLVVAGALVQADVWEQKVKSFIAELSDDELCELLLAFWMTGIQEDARLRLLVLAVEERSRAVSW